MSDVTRVIEALQRGDRKAADELLPLVYEELRRLATTLYGTTEQGGNSGNGTIFALKTAG